MQADEFDYKRIADPVHGTIGISRVEAAVIDTPIFQRLHDVKQLGLASLVYPGANYTRFSHSLGACHVAGRLIRTILSREDKSDDVKTIQTYRLAGLLHDIGHLPFSHATERAVKEHYGAMNSDANVITPGQRFSHENIGGWILAHDKDLRSALNGAVTPEDVMGVLASGSTAPYRNIISSDLDADRLDYLLRTAHFTGLPYGSIDIDYIVSRVCLDENNQVALTRQALRAADQFLLSRYFDYRQVAYHKTTAGLEWVLEDLIKALLEIDFSTDLSQAGITQLIKDDKWKSITDSFMREWIAKKFTAIEMFPPGLDSAKSRAAATTLRLKAKALLQRLPPKLVGEIEIFEQREQRTGGDRDSFKSTLETIRGAIPQWAKKFEIPEDRWNVWSTDLVLTKVGSHVPTSVLYEQEQTGVPKGYNETILLADKHRGKSRPIFNVPQSLTSFMADYNVRIVRIYVLLDHDDDRRAEIERHIISMYPHEGWTASVFAGG